MAVNICRKLKSKEYIIFENEETRISISKKKNKYYVQVDEVRIIKIGSIRSYKTYTNLNEFVFNERKIINDIVSHYEFDDRKFSIHDTLPNHIMVY